MNKRTTGLFYHCVIFNKNNMDSKLEVRAAAVKLAAKVDGVNNENVVDVAKIIESYIIGNAELPESNTTTEKTNSMMSRIIEAMGVSSQTSYGCTAKVPDSFFNENNEEKQPEETSC